MWNDETDGGDEIMYTETDVKALWVDWRDTNINKPE